MPFRCLRRCRWSQWSHDRGADLDGGVERCCSPSSAVLLSMFPISPANGLFHEIFRFSNVVWSPRSILLRAIKPCRLPCPSRGLSWVA